MIIGEYTLEIKGNNTQGQRSGIGIGIKVDDVKEKAGNIEIEYSFQANYRDEGNILIRGVMIAQEEDAKKIMAEWKKNKQLPEEFAKMVYTAINYSGTSNGTLISRVLGLTAPIIPPEVRMEPEEGI